MKKTNSRKYHQGYADGCNDVYKYLNRYGYRKVIEVSAKSSMVFKDYNTFCNACMFFDQIPLLTGQVGSIFGMDVVVKEDKSKKMTYSIRVVDFKRLQEYIRKLKEHE